MITFRVDAIPVAQPRQRHRVVSAGGRTFSQNYTPKSDPVNTFKAAVQAACIRHATEPREGPVRLELVFVFPRLASASKRITARCPKSTKPDIDNLIKSFCDAANGLLWLDDSQVCDLTAIKTFAAVGEQAGVEVVVESLQGAGR